MTNATPTRTDVHRPIEMDPADYEFIFCFDTHEPAINPHETWLREQFYAKQHKGGNFDTKGSCDHCGAHLRYVAILEHTPTGEQIAVGETCLDNRFSLVSKAQFDRLRKDAALDRQKQRIKEAARSYVADLLATSDPIGNRLGLAMSRDEDSKEFTDLTPMLKPGWAIDTFTDIRRKVWNQYGAPTTRQQDLLIRLLDEGEAFHAEQAKPKAPEAAKVPAPTGRVDFEGKVVFRKWYESDFGSTCKIVVVVTEAEGEWSVFVTEPSSISTEKGDIVRMRATLKEGRDIYSAKGSRPSNAEIVREAGAPELPDALA